MREWYQKATWEWPYYFNLTNNKHGERKQIIKDEQVLTRREMAMGGLLVLLMKSLFSTTLLKGALERRAKNLYS